MDRSSGYVPQAWVGMLPSIFDFTSSSSSHPLSSIAAGISTGPLAASFAFISIILAFFLVRVSKDSKIANMANGLTTNDNGSGLNGKPADRSADFEGDIKVDNKPPTKEQLERAADIPVLDVNKKSHTFKSLYADNEQGPRRVLVVFIRHFFCGVSAPS